MRFGALQAGVCWLLSALLTANNGLPLVLEHAHPVGRDLQHNLHAGAAVLPANVLSARGARSSHPRGGECSAAMLAVTPHIHLVWFGFEFTLLPPDDPGPDQDDSPSACGSLARMADSRLLDHEPPDVVGAPPSELAVTGGLAAMPARRATRDVAALPLCDTARHQRSGVQLV